MWSQCIGLLSLTSVFLTYSNPYSGLCFHSLKTFIYIFLTKTVAYFYLNSIHIPNHNALRAIALSRIKQIHSTIMRSLGLWFILWIGRFAPPFSVCSISTSYFRNLLSMQKPIERLGLCAMVDRTHNENKNEMERYEYLFRILHCKAKLGRG